MSSELTMTEPPSRYSTSPEGDSLIVDTISIVDSVDSLLLKLTTTIAGGSGTVAPAGGLELTKRARGARILTPAKRRRTTPKKNRSTREVTSITGWLATCSTKSKCFRTLFADVIDNQAFQVLLTSPL